MKLRATKKDISEYSNVFKLGYCELQNYIRLFDCIAYTAGKYEWSADLYKIKICIDERKRIYTHTFYVCTGYCPTGNLKLSKESKETLEKLDIELRSATVGSEEERILINKMTNIFLRELSQFYKKKLDYEIESYLPE